MELHYDVHEGDGPFLLLVHGILSSRAQWQPNLPALARVTRPVVVELWGHGRSPTPEDASVYHPDAYVAAFDALRERLGASRWLVCGQSLGATLTLRYALDHPERVLTQVFTNSTSALADAEWVEGIRTEGSRQADGWRQHGLCRAWRQMSPARPYRHSCASMCSSLLCSSWFPSWSSDCMRGPQAPLVRGLHPGFCSPATG